jgi:hypothetical protein
LTGPVRPVDAAVEAAQRAGEILTGYFGAFDPSWVE